VTDQPQLPLLDRTGTEVAPTSAARPTTQGEWRIDERTRLVGRRGVAAARAALARSVEGPEAHAA